MVKTVTDLTDGWYYIKNTGSDLYLSVENDSAKANANVEISSFSGSDGQKWKLTSVGGGYFTLTSGLGNFNLDIANAKDEDMTNVLIYNAHGGDAQKFSVKSNGGDSFAIVSYVSSGLKAIDVYNFGTTPGSNVHQYSLNDKPNQDWVFECIDCKSSSGGKTNSNGKCWSEAYGYPCCKTCGPVYFTDDQGQWGIENDDWCGINCTGAKSAGKCTGAQGFPCCKSTCDVYFVDDDGEWGVENDWCLIDNSIC